MNSDQPFHISRLEWVDEELGAIALPKAPLRLRASFGSGLSSRPNGPPERIWAVGDRGPNLKIKTLEERYGVPPLGGHQDLQGAKVMPRLDLGPQIAELEVDDVSVRLIATHRITDTAGHAVSGLPVPQSEHARCEPALDLEGNMIDPDPSGLDTEGIVALSDGGFWVGDEFGPSLLRLDERGRVLTRHVPQGVSLPGAAYRVEPSLPAIAARRHLNRGFEAIGLSPDEKWLLLAFQSPLAHPDEDAHKDARHVRIWKLEARTLAVAAEYLYRLDDPWTFKRDRDKGELERSDLKVSELVCLAHDSLLLLERGSETTKIYRCRLDPSFALPPDYLDLAHRPTVEELSANDDFRLPVLPKQLIFSTDSAPQVAADLEGMVVLSPNALLLVNDNDFGVEGATTSFWRVSFDQPVFG